MNNRAYRPCRYCGEVLCYFEMKEHAGHCPKNPRVTVCRFCGAALNVKTDFQSHPAVCPSMPPIPAGSKLCSACQEAKPLDSFAIDAREPSGRHGQCKVCHRARGKVARGTPTGKAKKRKNHLRSLYGITGESFEELAAAQGGKCAICGKPPGGGTKDRHLVVDHDHATGKVRGLLCSHCNHGVGKFRDDPALLIAAIDYLLRHRPVIAIA